MSKAFFAGLSIVVFVILIICAYRCRKGHGSLGKSIAAFLLSGAAAVVGYGLVFSSEEYRILSIGYSLFFLSMDWVCYTMLRYAVEYTRHKGKKFISFDKKVPRIIEAVLILDSISIFCNIFFEHVVTYDVIVYQGERYLRTTQQPWYYVHLLLCYVMFSVVLYLFIKKTITAPKLYKKKYYMVLAILAGLVLADACALIFKPAVNMTVLTYAVAAILIDYFTFHYIPQYMERNIQKLTQYKQQDMIVMFDNEDNCIYKNGKAMLFLSDYSRMDKESFEDAWNYEDDTRKVAVLENDEKKLFFAKEHEELTDTQGRYMGCFFVMHDITKERELQEKYRYLATHDALTGLYNRSFFFEKAKEFMMRNPDEKYLIICSDIRQFSTVNDIFGVETGDKILKVMAQDLLEKDNKDSVYGRIAGDSFAICIAEEKFERIASMFENGNVLHIKNINYPIVNHIGVYKIKDLSMSVSSMCDRAMFAIDSIKNDMQRGIAYYDDEIREKLLEEKAIVKDLLPAFEEKQFTVYLQPQISHSTGSIVGAETLVRWNHPEKGIIAPNHFIPLMENNGLISKLDQYIWRMACELLKKYEKQGKEISLSVNISAKDFYYLDLYHEFMDLVKEYDIEPSRLKLEITESAVMLDVPKQVALIKKLQAEGFIIEMDDFGSGYSSLNTLKDIPVDILKLDMKFMGQAEDASRSANILQMVVGMADKLAMPVIAEGVEEKAQADFLGSIGCDVVQGYLYAKPMPIEEFDRLLEKYPYKEIMERA